MMAPIALNFFVAALPTVVFVLWAARRSGNGYSKFYSAFLIGLVSVPPALLLMLLVSAPLSRYGGLPGDALQAFVVAGLVEEIVKLGAVSWSLKRLSAAGDAPTERRGAGTWPATGTWPSTGPRPAAGSKGLTGPARQSLTASPVLIAATAGLGFAFMENAFYIVGSSSVLFARAVLAVPLHGATAAYLGVAVAGRHTDKSVSVGAALALAVFVHGAYDLTVKHAAFVAPFVVTAAVVLAVLLAPRKARPA